MIMMKVLGSYWRVLCDFAVEDLRMLLFMVIPAISAAITTAIPTKCT